MKKKGDLALSVNAIVIVVISFVVLGLALTLTRSIFKFAGERAESVIPLTELEAKPSPENPISISDTLAIKKSGTLTLSIGFYNTKDETAEWATFSIADCLNEEGQSIVDISPDKLPIVQSPAQTVDSSAAKAYKIILKDNGLDTGMYICTLNVHKKENQDKVYESKQFFLKVTA